MAPLLLVLLLPALLPPPPPAPAPAPAPPPARGAPRGRGHNGRDWTGGRGSLPGVPGGTRRPHLSPPQDGMQLLEEPQNWPPRIRCSDACDPLALETNSTRCLQRIRQALQHYRDLLGSDIFRDQPQPQLETTMEQLLRHVQRQIQRHLALKRLRSFAAVMSRVFNHSAR
ncbi:IL23A protein, partial [Zosterops hypoxanthus]|nr:IL23A protein [Zosterops hypoxanthus]